ncbi:hypothetical protein, partial [Chitinivorax tropicus]|uniref:hypothetical protein n=1 Tax=Chitinivorax tropicus TaxID=714531 RepID=UPI001C84C19D
WPALIADWVVLLRLSLVKPSVMPPLPGDCCFCGALGPLPVFWLGFCPLSLFCEAILSTKI